MWQISRAHSLACHFGVAIFAEGSQIDTNSQCAVLFLSLRDFLSFVLLESRTIVPVVKIKIKKKLGFEIKYIIFYMESVTTMITDNLTWIVNVRFYWSSGYILNLMVKVGKMQLQLFNTCLIKIRLKKPT